MSGGTLTGDGAGLACDGSTVNNITISGGVIQGEEAGFYYCSTDCSGEVVISGGSISGDGADIYISDTASTASAATISLNGYNGTALTFGLDSSAAEGSYIAKEVSGDGLVVLTGSSHVASYDAANRAVRLGTTAHTHNFNATTHKCTCGKIGGTCGANLIWDFDEIADTLTISGTGAMDDYMEPTDAPWYTYQDKIKTLVVGNDVTTIGSGAFYGYNAYTYGSYKNLVQINLGNKVKSIGASAFYGCSGITELVLPDSVTEIGKFAFSHCSNMEEVTWSKNLKVIPEGAFERSGLTEVTLPEGLTTIEKGAFWTCTNLTKVVIPDSVTDFGDYVFDQCSELKEVVLPVNLNTIPEQTFSYCDALETVVIPESVITIGNRAFYACNNLYTIEIPAGVTTIEGDAFGSSGIEEIYFTGNVPTFGGDVFYEITATVYYPANDTTWTEVVGQQYGGTITWQPYDVKNDAEISGICGTNLTWEFNEVARTLTISGTGAIPNSALPWVAYKDQIKSIVIGDGIETIYQSAFSNYTNLTSVSLPDTMVIIGKSAFSGCSNLTSITIPASVTTIGDSAFAGTGLTSVEYKGVKCPSGSNSVFPATVTQVTVPNRYDGTTFCGVNVKCNHPDCTPGNHTWEHGARDDDCFVSFNMKGHGEAIADKRVPKDDNTEAPTAPVAAGYAFGGWYTDEACTNAFDFATSITANITLYAKWTEAEASWYVGETLTGSGTFGQAVAAVNGGSGVTKIQLFKNVDCNGAYFVAGTTVTLELNGKTITRKSGYIGVKNNLTIQDSSSEKTGTIDSIVDEYDACMVVTDNGHLTIQSGNYKNGGTVGAISIKSANASCTINGGDFTVGYFQVANYDGTLTINGGSFTPIPLGYSIFVGSKTTIYNATFHSTGLPAIGYSGGELIFVDSVPANTRLKNPGTLAITDPDITLPAGYVIKDENGNEATVLLPDGPVDSGKIYSIEKAAYSVIVTNDGNGTGIATPASGAAGTEITLTATPNSGYKFKEWQVISGGVTVANNKFTIGTSDVEVKAIFEKDTPETPSEPTTYNINIDGSITDGTVVADKTEAAAGETVILTVTPANGYALDTLKVNNEAVTVANNKYTFTMPAGDVTVTATFKSTKVFVDGITIDAGSVSLLVGTSKNLLAVVTPDNASDRTLSWTSSDESVATVTAGANTATATVTAVKPGTGTVTVKAEDGSDISALCTVQVSYLEAPTLSELRISGYDYSADGVYWFGDGKDAAVMAPDGYGIATASNGTYGPDITLGQADSFRVYLKRTTDGALTDAIDLSRILKWDTAAPTGTVKVGEKTWDDLRENISFVVFSKETRTAAITAMDTDSGVKSIEYYVSEESLSKEELVQKQWTAGESAELPLPGKHIVYARITDNMGNVTYLSSDGIVLFRDSTADISEVSYTYKENADRSVPVRLYGNTIKAVTLDGTDLVNGTDYTLSAVENASEDEILLKGTFLDTLDAGEYYLSVSFNPLGETMATDSEVEIAELDLKVSVAQRELTLISAAATDRIYEKDNREVEITAVEIGCVAGDAVTVTARGILASDAAGDYRKVTLSDVMVSGADAANYVLTDQLEINTDVTISPKSLNHGDITLALADRVIFGGNPVVTVKDGTAVLEEDKDFTLKQTGTEGECSITVTGKGNYRDEADMTYLAVKLPDPNKVKPDDKTAIDAYDRYTELNKTYQDEELAEKLEELKKALTAYDIIEGHKATYTKGSGKTFRIIANGYFGKFTGLKVDGKLLDSGNYTVKSGSTVVTLKNSYLDRLSDGKHTIEFLYTDGTTGEGHYFRIASNNGSPFTGDNSHLQLLGGIMMTSLLCMAVMGLCVPRKKGKYQR